MLDMNFVNELIEFTVAGTARPVYDSDNYTVYAPPSKREMAGLIDDDMTNNAAFAYRMTESPLLVTWKRSGNKQDFFVYRDGDEVKVLSDSVTPIKSDDLLKALELDGFDYNEYI